VERTSSRAGVAPVEVQRLSRRTVSPTNLTRYIFHEKLGSGADPLGGLLFLLVLLAICGGGPIRLFAGNMVKGFRAGGWYTIQVRVEFGECRGTLPIRPQQLRIIVLLTIAFLIDFQVLFILDPLPYSFNILDNLF
jgi:hypothetical protein